uniref:Envelope protein n=1 Tax=Myoviridae sp. ctWaE18 TaxID=2826662 RepID=A0A8S5MXK4_9CAUD|nr:MAG TPA: envelope protein [Myoviridae sp. ctWaE18]
MKFAQGVAMFKLSQETIDQIMNVIIPEIKGAAEESLRAYEQGAREDGGNNFDNYMLGCTCWCSVYNRLDRKLTQHPFFSKKTYKKVLTITCPNGDSQLKFYVSRVDEKGRVPCAGKSIKVQLQEQAFLSDEVQNIIARSESSVFMIGYDISHLTGLGKITFDMLSVVDRKHFQSDTLHVFEGEDHTVPAHRTPQEEIKRPAVTREILANQQKKATK